MMNVLRVVIADDALEVRQRVRERLVEIPGVEVVGEACDANEAMMVIMATTPDIVLLDIQMPGGGGLTVLENLNTFSNRIVAIMLSNYSSPQYRKKCRAAGAHAFFDKTSEFEEAVELLKALCEKLSSHPKRGSGMHKV